MVTVTLGSIQKHSTCWFVDPTTVGYWGVRQDPIPRQDASDVRAPMEILMVKLKAKLSFVACLPFDLVDLSV
jgi:hypothetical protein